LKHKINHVIIHLIFPFCNAILLRTVSCCLVAFECQLFDSILQIHVRYILHIDHCEVPWFSSWFDFPPSSWTLWIYKELHFFISENIPKSF
jgi:hypothetical protein